MSNSTDQLGEQMNAAAQYYAKIYCVMISEVADWIWNGRPQAHPIGQLDPH